MLCCSWPQRFFSWQLASFPCPWCSWLLVLCFWPLVVVAAAVQVQGQIQIQTLHLSDLNLQHLLSIWHWQVVLLQILILKTLSLVVSLCQVLLDFLKFQM